jgi:hypothetical protein
MFYQKELQKHVDTYRAIRAQIDALEEELAPVKAALEQAARDNGGTVRTDDAVIKLVDCERESISVKEAKACLGDALKPFLKVSFYTSLRVN